MTKGRLEAFSDGVIAVIITIMVLEMKVPHGTDAAALAPLVPTFLTLAVYPGVQRVTSGRPTKTEPGEQLGSGSGPRTRQPLQRVRRVSSRVRYGAAGAAGAAPPARRQRYG